MKPSLRKLLLNKQWPILANRLSYCQRSLQRQVATRNQPTSWLIVSILLLASCVNSTQQATTHDGLSGVSSPMDELYIRSTSQFSQFRHFYFEPLTVTYSRQKRSDSLNRPATDFKFDKKEMAIFEQKFQTSFSQQWQQIHNWTAAQQPGVGVLVVRATVSDLFLYASIKNNSRSPSASLADETSKMQLQIELIDAANQQVLLRMRDQKTTGRPGAGSQQMTRVTSVSYWHDVQRMFRRTAISLSHYLAT